MPSLRSSPRIRSAPQSRFSLASCWIRSTVSGEMRGAEASGPRSHSPKEPEALPVPTEDRVGFHEEKSLSPSRDKTGETQEKPTLVRGEPRLLDRPCLDEELLPQERVLGDQLVPRADRVPDQTADHRGRPRHSAHSLLRALRHSEREAPNPSNEGSKHGTNLQPTRDPFNLPGAKSSQHRHMRPGLLRVVCRAPHEFRATFGPGSRLKCGGWKSPVPYEFEQLSDAPAEGKRENPSTQGFTRRRQTA
jgi:hypothetical protein